MASPIVKGNTFNTTDTVTSTTLNNIVDNSTFKGTDGNGVSFSASSGGDLGTCVAAGGLEVHSTGQLQLKDSGITTAKLADSSSKTTGVTFAKMQHISTSHVLGRTTASEGDVEEVDIVIGGSGDAGLLFDNDDMLDNSDTAGGSATRGATQQSIKAYVLAISNQYFHLQETEGSGTNSTTTLTGNAYTKRPVASVSNNIASASVSTGVITLPAGTYEVKAFGLCDSDGVNQTPNRTRFRNTSDSTTAILGASVVTIGMSGVDFETAPVAFLQGVFTISGSKNFELQHYKDGSGNVPGGQAVDSGDNEVYADVLIKKLD